MQLITLRKTLSAKAAHLMVPEINFLNRLYLKSMSSKIEPNRNFVYYSLTDYMYLH